MAPKSSVRKHNRMMTRSHICRGLLAAAAQDDEGEGGAVTALDSASAAGDAPEVACSPHSLLLVKMLVMPGHWTLHIPPWQSDRMPTSPMVDPVLHVS